MGDIMFHKGMDDMYTQGGKTQPSEPNMASGGPIEGYAGCDEGHSYGTMTGNKSIPDGNVIDSPMDK